MNLENFSYDNKVVKNFAFASVFWGTIGMLVGVIIAMQLYLPVMNFDTSWLTFGR